MDQTQKELVLNYWRTTSLKYYHEHKEVINAKRKLKRDLVKEQLKLLQQLQQH